MRAYVAYREQDTLNVCYFLLLLLDRGMVGCSVLLRLSCCSLYLLDESLEVGRGEIHPLREQRIQARAAGCIPRLVRDVSDGDFDPQLIAYPVGSECNEVEGSLA